MGYKKWTDEQLIIAVKNSKTISDVVRGIGLKSTNSGNHQTVRAKIKQLGLDISHFSESVVGKHPITKEKELSEVLIKDSTYASSRHLKKKLLKFSLVKDLCSECGITHWQNKKLSLHLDHINGIRDDNRIENLRLLCPNCHSLTETYCVGNTRLQNMRRCIDCNTLVTGKSIRCMKCDSGRKRNCKISWPPVEELITMVQASNFLQVAKTLGVTDNTLRKRIKTRSPEGLASLVKPKTIECNCAFCNKKRIVFRSHVRRCKHIFCGKECRNAFYKKHSKNE